MKNLVHPGDLAEQACQIEIDILKEPIGKQDQYIAAYGGITCFRFLPNGQVEAWPLKISQRTLYDLEDHLLLFFTGYTRSAGEILKEQDARSKKHDPEMVANLHFVKQIGRDSKDALEARRPAGVRRADEHALGAQEGPVQVDEQRPDRPLVRPGDPATAPSAAS